MSAAVCLTMPSVGIRSVASTQARSVAASSAARVLWAQSTARFWVRMRLVTSSTGVAVAAANSAITMRAP